MKKLLIGLGLCVYLFLCYHAYMGYTEGTKGTEVAKTEIGEVVDIHIPHKAYKHRATIYVKVPDGSIQEIYQYSKDITVTAGSPIEITYYVYPDAPVKSIEILRSISVVVAPALALTYLIGLFGFYMFRD